jgi:hypothetical protein
MSPVDELHRDRETVERGSVPEVDTGRAVLVGDKLSKTNLTARLRVRDDVASSREGLGIQDLNVHNGVS